MAGLRRTAAPRTAPAPGQSGHSGSALSAEAATCASGPGRSLTVVPSVAGMDAREEHIGISVHVCLGTYSEYKDLITYDV